MPCVSSAMVLVACSMGLGPGAVDVVTLRDGKTVAGEVIEHWAPGSVGVYVRRAWAHDHVPDLADRWEAAEKPTTRLANAQRRVRLEAWRRDRKLAGADPAQDKGDRITPWIDRELDRIREQGDASNSPIMIARIPRGEVKGIVRAPRGRARLLHLAWAAEIEEPEGLSLDDLKGALDSRGLDVTANDPVPIEPLLPPRTETESAWLIRRAATEVSYDRDLKFIRHQGLVLPERDSAVPVDEGSALAGIEALKDLLGEKSVDPLAAPLRKVAERGRVGAIVTSLEIAADFSGAGVTIALWVRRGGNNWSVAGSRSAQVRVADLRPDAGQELADDPRVAQAFRIIEALGFGEAAQDLKRNSLAVGAATRKALGLAREAANADLARLVLPVMDSREK